MSDSNATGRTPADLFYEIFFKHRGMKIALVIIALISLSAYFYLQYKNGHNDHSGTSTLSITPGGGSNTGKSTMTLTGVVPTWLSDKNMTRQRWMNNRSAYATREKTT